MKYLHLMLIVCGGLLATAASAQAPVDEVIEEGQSRLEDNQQAQKNVDKVHSETRSLVDQYQTLLKVVDDLTVYNAILATQIENQEEEKAAVNFSIANAAVIERQILPLLVRMLDSLERFVAADLPFLQTERTERIARLRRLITNPNLSNAEKTRRVFEAYQIEIDYGNTIEDYKGKLDLEGRTFDVDYLRIGRVALAYRTVGAEEYGYWDAANNTWQPLTSSLYKRNIDKGLRMARQEMAPELITIPLANAGEAP